MNLSLVEYRSREVVKTLEQLTDFCKTVDVRSIAFIVQIGPREHKMGLAGGYRLRPADAFGALHLLERKLRWEKSFDFEIAS